ncbi:MAG: response regulator [Eubacterium sp.]|nr:response regulator [Eubacterium sp.]
MKVFLVEDEYIVREGIKNNIDWEKNGYDFCGEASDGELAFPMISEKRPDIVITDIRMPFMDGIELSRMIKEEYPEIKIIILSGHEEFEYAKAAIQIGVEEYLLKPINGDELLQVVNRVAQKIKEENESRETLQEGEGDENFEYAKRQLLSSLIDDNASLSDAMEQGKKIHLNLMAQCYNIMMLKLQRKNKEQGFSQRIVELYKTMEEILEEQNGQSIVFDRAPEGKVILFMGSGEEEIRQNMDAFASRFREILPEYEDVTYFGSIGIPVMRLRELGESYDAASHGFSYRFLTEPNQIVDNNTVFDQTREEKTFSCSIGSVDIQNLDKQKIESFLKGGEMDEIQFFVEEYMKNTGDAGKNSMIFRQYIVMDMFFAASHFLAQITDGREQLGEPFESPEQMQKIVSDLEATVTYIKDLFTRVMQVRDAQTTEHNSDVVENAKKYISENYHDEELTLNTVAHEVNVSPNHLSAMFSQKTGQTFVKYLTDVRMHRAKELLKCTSKRSNEICEEVGYRDPHYFSHLFKKNVGCSPMQYRERGGKE